jgi:hypothetical protein
MKTCLACLLIATAAAVRVAAEELHPERAASTSPLQTTATESGTGKGISASPSQPELTGQIFIVTKGHESIKLGLVTVQAFDPAQVNASIESTQTLIANEQQRLNQIGRRSIDFTSKRSALFMKRRGNGGNRRWNSIWML